jgi:predicted Zn-dependent protease
LAPKGKVLHAYPKMPEPTLAFRSMALALKNAFRLDDLQDLIDLHTEKHADDAYLSLFRAELYARDERFDLAEKAYAAALAKVNDAQYLDAFRANRVLVRYRTGDVLGAYRQIGPSRPTFLQLADLCWYDKKTDDLVALVDAHAKNDAQDPKLVQYRWRAKIRRGDIDDAAAIMKAALAAIKDADERKRLNEDFVFDLIDSNQALAAYRHSINPADALSLMMNDLLDSRRLDELRAVSEAHRKQFPNDPFLAIAAGEIALAEKKWDKAAQAYTEAWKTLPEAQKERWQYSYATARFKAGQALQAYQDAGGRREVFRELARQILAAKQADLFEQLLEAHRPRRKDDPHFDAYEASLLVIRGKTDEAAALFTRCWMSVPESDRPAVQASFVATLAEWHPHGLSAYALSIDKRAAFQSLTWRYRNPKQIAEFERLIEEHAKNDPSDPKLPLERAELHLLRGDLALAEKQFVLAKDKGNANDAHLIRLGLVRTRVRLGKVVETYQEFGADNQTFSDLARECAQEKKPDQLQALLAAHRQAVPKFKNASVWELEICWLKNDYAGVIDRVQSDQTGLLTNPATRWKAEGYLVRSLVPSRSIAASTDRISWSPWRWPPTAT